MTEAVSAAIEAALLEVRTVTAGRIESYDATDQRATVLPLLKRKTAAGEVLTPKPIGNVQVLHFGAGGFAFTLPVAAGNVGILLCFDRSLDLWLESGGQVDPQSRRHHSLTDALFLPLRLHPWSDPVPTADASDLVIAKDDTSIQIRLSTGGVCTVRGAAGVVSGALVDGVALSFHTALAASLTEITGLLAGLGLLAPYTTGTFLPALAANTWRAAKLEAE